MDTETIRWKGRLGPIDLQVGPDTFRPTTISALMAEAMEVKPGDTVIDVGCGSGILSIIAAKLGAGRVFGVDAAAGTVEVATANARAQGVEDRIEFFQGDVVQPIPDDVEADLILGDISGIPDEIASVSGWFPSGLSGGPTGAELPLRMIEEVRRVLRKGGRLLLPTGTLQDERTILDRARDAFGNLRQLAERAIPLPTNLAEHPALTRMVKDKLVDVTRKGSRYLWTARVWEVTG
ncbi:MAG: 50S ribosomal protein L11 methyltransferase [Acidimicrobiales bacterium]|jgi:methylase of polypeptide subunit release factors|nr:50S ribosomal protein L11 methyltransferase [Acidimicrobiales bacterium]HLV91380.1 50S ribosomal protein L11 methyltransferase [Acidimicrobiia bacterium]